MKKVKKYVIISNKEKYNKQREYVMNIILIGMPGSGKSTLGVVTAKILGMDFLDADVFIQKNEGRKLQEILDEVGCENFLDTECKNILKIDVDNTVIATGGSAVLREKAMLHLKKNAKTVFLDVPLKEIEKRIFNISVRGIAKNESETMEDIFQKRYPLYEKYADIILKTGTMTQEEAIKLIIKNIAEEIE